MSYKKYSLFSLIVICLSLGLFSCSKKENDAKKDDIPTDTGEQKEVRKTRNLVVVTLDGYRWQEVFKGADSSLLFGFDEEYISQDVSLLKQRFWSENIKERRKKLMPFFWNYLVKHGKLYGNRDIGSKINVKNPYSISYPGYNEIWTGYPDPDIEDNSYGENPNYNVLETINSKDGFKGKVAVFTTWKKFYDILNNRRNQLHQISGEDNLLSHKGDEGVSTVLNEMYTNLDFYSYDRKDTIYDKVAYAVAKSYMKEKHPRVLYIAFGHTDDLAHAGKYDFYLEEAHNIDAMIGDLWEYIQQDPFYRDSTTLFVTCDHGRGLGSNWTSHGSSKYPYSSETWCAVIGPDTKALGEINKPVQFYQNQYATSFAAFLGLRFNSNLHPVGLRIKDFMDND